jgi:hypothetical protein
MLQRRRGAEEQRAASMFLFRLAFWIGLAILVLPSDERQQERLYATAVATVERAATFCDRNPKVCAAGGELWAMFLKKAEFGARMAINVAGSGGHASSDAAPASQPSAGMRSGPEPRTSPAAARGTLTPSDLAPAWRGQLQRTGT